MSRIAEIRERLEQVRSGPWAVEVVDHKMSFIGPEVGRTHPYDGDLPIVERVFETWGRNTTLEECNFIAAAREDIPWLLTQLEEAQEVKKEAIELIQVAWQQWSYETSKGNRWAGGLSTLEDIEAFLAQHQGGQDAE